MFTIDAHLDLSMNALEWNRDLTQPLASINAREAGLSDKPDRGKATVSLPELRKGTRQHKPGHRHRDNWPGMKPWKMQVKWFRFEISRVSSDMLQVG
jgi:hypothetical protein